MYCIIIHLSFLNCGFDFSSERYRTSTVSSRNLCTSRMRSQPQLRNDKYIMKLRYTSFHINLVQTIPCTVYLERHWDCLWNFSIMILIALMCARISPSPDNFKRIINTRLSRLHCLVALNHWQRLYSHFTLIFGRDKFKDIRRYQ